ncbi:hypothetical protein CRG98_043655 [Punica granatum]|uniref:Uncharacterized protein n=1 Tax=Punica granatum TaxID=22663 RepID=A0A2I0HW75_PUNGR|nr:hypothetical protein CRG98_043655 [Punica granatum]
MEHRDGPQVIDGWRPHAMEEERRDGIEISASVAIHHPLRPRGCTRGVIYTYRIPLAIGSQHVEVIAPTCNKTLVRLEADWRQRRVVGRAPDETLHQLPRLRLWPTPQPIGLVRTQILISSGHACARLCNAAWECPPSQGPATDAREKESPLPVYNLKVESW